MSTNSRNRYTIRAGDIVEVLAHRKRSGNEEYLVRWRTKPVLPCPPRAIASWHPLPDLRKSLHLVQSYVEKNGHSGRGTPKFSSNDSSRKRKSPEDDGPLSRGLLGANGLLTPQDSMRSRSHSPSTIDLIKAAPQQVDGPQIYNGAFQFKEGNIIAKADLTGDVVNTRNLPTPSMTKESAVTPVDQAERAIRLAFVEKLKKVKRVRLENHFDSTTPNLNFEFIKDYVLGEGVSGDEPTTFQGCQKCKPDMGGGVGCEYTAICECLEFASVDEQTLSRKDPEKYGVYLIAKEDAEKNGDGIDTKGLPKRFPYSKPRANGAPQTLVPFYREQRYPVYECNHNCKCGSVCKSRLVQKGRKVPLVIFKTGKDRGWGICCEEDLIQGEFVDVYLGEVIANDEANRREDHNNRNVDESAKRDSYFYWLDKFKNDRDPTTDKILRRKDLYVIDGEHMGNATRFINHSCEPNMRQYSVSYNKHDLKLYSMAFFAYTDIPAETELTFDYLDKDEVELEEAIALREAALNDPRNADKPRCYCGQPKCRGFLWDDEDDKDSSDSSQQGSDDDSSED
ncbi:hypothetical protein CKM354_000359700 [Cercospora kikuchii]|uniref:SET domain-containing protein n=1 Tax=Cercospora kikuchii TaxID=84275 RepID=A0A9P3CC60_9PEZI|nr:uncharacterized protein CKM354_000359700 [Cercospora kikuchii]GIZ40249.1 hypothetical protein CKM354_000359700 [Cercospora kikuchii]